MFARLAAALSLALMVTGCASVARGTTDQVSFDTVPAGAEVRVTVPAAFASADAIVPLPTMGCVTPCVLQVKRNDKMAVTISKAGFETETFPVASEASREGVGTALAGNLLLLGGVVGTVVDGFSGAMLDHCPNPVRLNLRPVAGGRGARAQPGFGFDPVAACKAQTEAKYSAGGPPKSETPAN